MASVFGACPFLIKLYADGGGQGREFHSTMGQILVRINVPIVKRSGQAVGFVALLQRRLVERTFAIWVDVDDWQRTGEYPSHKALAFPLVHIRLVFAETTHPT